MLLPSPRHTPADLDLWAELEECDRIHGEKMLVARKGVNAIAVMMEFADAGPCYASTSWGKDSTVVSHLLSLSGLPVPLANVAQLGTGSDPHIPDVRDAFLSRWKVREYFEQPVSLLAIPDDGGHSPSLDAGIRLLRERFGTGRYIGGVRADESTVRKISMCASGLSSENTCRPIGRWDADDVFGWLAIHGLPVHPNYAMLGGGRWKRDRIRVSTIGGPKGTGGGRREWELEYYGDVIRRLEAAS